MAGAGSTRRGEDLKLSFRAGGLILLLVSCAPATRPPAQSSNEQKIHATVITIQTTIQPANKTYMHTLFIAKDRARSGDEVDEWRLFDFAKRRVTFVDDLTRTYRSEPFDDLVTAPQPAMPPPRPQRMPPPAVP